MLQDFNAIDSYGGIGLEWEYTIWDTKNSTFVFREFLAWTNTPAACVGCHRLALSYYWKLFGTRETRRAAGDPHARFSHAMRLCYRHRHRVLWRVYVSSLLVFSATIKQKRNVDVAVNQDPERDRFFYIFIFKTRCLSLATSV